MVLLMTRFQLPPLIEIAWPSVLEIVQRSITELLALEHDSLAHCLPSGTWRGRADRQVSEYHVAPAGHINTESSRPRDCDSVHRYVVGVNQNRFRKACPIDGYVRGAIDRSQRDRLRNAEGNAEVGICG